MIRQVPDIYPHEQLKVHSAVVGLAVMDVGGSRGGWRWWWVAAADVGIVAAWPCAWPSPQRKKNGLKWLRMALNGF